VRTVGSDGDVTLKLIRRHAADLISEHGFEAMNLRQLARRVGITAGSLYNYIGSKQELLHGLLREVMEDLLDALDRLVVQQPTPLLQLQAFVQLHIQFHVQRRNDVLIATTELRSLEPRNRNSVIHLRNKYEAALSRIIRQGCRDRSFQVTDIKVATVAILPMLTGVALWYRSGGRLSREAMLLGYIRLALSLVGATPTEKLALLPMFDAVFDQEEPSHSGDESARNDRSSFGARRRVR
jgi:AcrR family transcriptional regulator